MGDTDSSRLSLTGSQIERLAAGFGDPSAIEVLREGQHSKFLQSLASIIDIAGPDASAAVELLDKAQALDEDACYEVLTYPHVGVWAWACIQQLMGVSDPDDDHVAHLSAIAAVAAYRCGLDNFEISVPVRDGGVVLPGLGRAVLGLTELCGEARVYCENGHLSVAFDDRVVRVPDRPASDGLDWQAIRLIRVESRGLELRVVIDDIDPYRNYYGYAARIPPADRLDDVGFKTWQELVFDAWSLLAEHHRDYAVGIAAGLRVMVPIEVGPGQDRSPEGFGAIALTNVSKQWIAYAMLDEFQRTKITALNLDFSRGTR